MKGSQKVRRTTLVGGAHISNWGGGGGAWGRYWRVLDALFDDGGWVQKMQIWVRGCIQAWSIILGYLAKKTAWDAKGFKV